MLNALALLLAVQGEAPRVELRSYLDSLEAKGFRGMLYVQQNGKELFFHGVGEANPKINTPFTKHSAFDIGSIVKPMVRAALIKLASQGKLSLNDSISKYFRYVPEEKRPITIQMLMDHRSGFRNIFGDDYEPTTQSQLMSTMLASDLMFAPGSKNRYSNSGYSMLATIVEKVTGESIERVINRLQFAQLGLRNTGYVLPKWKREDLVLGLGRRDGTPLDFFWYADGPSWNLRGNGGMLSTVVDLARWAHGINEGELLNEEELSSYDRWIVEGKPRPNVFGVSAGSNGVFFAMLGYNPAQKLCFVGVSANSRFSIGDVEGELIKRLKLLVRG